MLKNLLFVMTALLLAGALSACNTVEGVGKDMESAGRGIQNAF